MEEETSASNAKRAILRLKNTQICRRLQLKTSHQHQSLKWAESNKMRRYVPLNSRRPNGTSLIQRQCKHRRLPQASGILWQAKQTPSLLSLMAMMTTMKKISMECAFLLLFGVKSKSSSAVHSTMTSLRHRCPAATPSVPSLWRRQQMHRHHQCMK